MPGASGWDAAAGGADKAPNEKGAGETAADDAAGCEAAPNPSDAGPFEAAMPNANGAGVLAGASEAAVLATTSVVAAAVPDSGGPGRVAGTAASAEVEAAGGNEKGRAPPPNVRPPLIAGASSDLLFLVGPSASDACRRQSHSASQ